MPRLPVDKIQPGMQLTKHAENSSGALLVERGTVTTEELIEKLRNAGVQYVFVRAALDDAQLSDMLSALDARFARVKEEPPYVCTQGVAEGTYRGDLRVIAARSVRAQMEDLEALPTIPTILRRLLETFENPRVSLSEIGSFIAQDPILAAKILKVVNSPIYGFPGRVSSITQALLLLGLNIARGLLLGVSVIEIMQKSIVGLWEHSVGCAIVAKLVAKKKRLRDPEEVAVAALLHDIGKVLLNLKFPEAYQHAIADAHARGLCIMDVEREYFGVTHAEVEAWVGKKWNFPHGLVEQMRYHHTPYLAKNLRLHTAIVHFSDILIRGRGFGYGGDAVVPTVDDTAWGLLSLSRADIKETLIETEDLLDRAEDLILTGKAV